MYSTTEVAEILNISRATIFRALRQGRIKAIKIGNIWRISEEELERIKKQGF